MRLETEFVKLPLLFDAERLKEELAQFSEDDWMAHATGYAGNLSIPLISLEGGFNDALHGPMRPTSALGRCEYIQQIMDALGEVFSRSRLMRLEPGREVPPHVDANYHWHNRVRIHIPITTTEDVTFFCGNRHVHMAAGECWIFDSWSEHTVQNNSDQTRVHLVLDTTGSARFWDLVERGIWPFKDRQQFASEPSVVSYVPNKPTHVRTEIFNAPLVQSPGELENLIRALVDEIDDCPDNAEEDRTLFKKLMKDFVRAWREVWSEHGMKPSGWPLYYGLLNEADKAVSSITPDLILASNGYELTPAFRGIVLYSAINEEFAPQYLDRDELPEKLKKAIRKFSTDKRVLREDGDLAKKPDETKEIRRNDPCSCGSGKRYKHCHGRIE